MAVIKRGENVYLVRVYVGRHPITKRRIEINKTVRGSSDEAEKQERILKDKAKDGEVTKSPRMTVKQLIDSYLESTRRHRGEARQRVLRYYFDRFVIPYIGNIQITKIKKSDIQQLFDFLLDPKKEGLE